jgi:hypothetical protein
MMRVMIVLSGLALGACSSSDEPGSWLDAVSGPFLGDDTTPLEQILITSGDTPGNQGLLYTAMLEAEAADQSAGRAVVFADQPAELKSALGDVVYAIRPIAAPPWRARTVGLVPGWSGQGYGLIRAAQETESNLRQLESTEPARAGEALVCVRNTIDFATQALDRAESLLDEPSVADRSATLEQLHRFAVATMKGLDENGDGEVASDEGECGLEQAESILEPLRYRLES